MKITRGNRDRVRLFSVLVITACVQMIDAITTGILAAKYGWGGERNLLVKPIIENGLFYLIGLKVAVMTLVVILEVWLFKASPTTRETQQKFLWAYNLYAMGIVTGNILALMQMEE